MPSSSGKRRKVVKPVTRKNKSTGFDSKQRSQLRSFGRLSSSAYSSLFKKRSSQDSDTDWNEVAKLGRGARKYSLILRMRNAKIAEPAILLASFRKLVSKKVLQINSKEHKKQVESAHKTIQALINSNVKDLSSIPDSKHKRQLVKDIVTGFKAMYLEISIELMED